MVGDNGGCGGQGWGFPIDFQEFELLKMYYFLIQPQGLVSGLHSHWTFQPLTVLQSALIEEPNIGPPFIHSFTLTFRLQSMAAVMPWQQALIPLTSKKFSVSTKVSTLPGS